MYSSVMTRNIISEITFIFENLFKRFTADRNCEHNIINIIYSRVIVIKNSAQKKGGWNGRVMIKMVPLFNKSIKSKKILFCVIDYRHHLINIIIKFICYFTYIHILAIKSISTQ